MNIVHFKSSIYETQYVSYLTKKFTVFKFTNDPICKLHIAPLLAIKPVVSQLCDVTNSAHMSTSSTQIEFIDR